MLENQPDHLGVDLDALRQGQVVLLQSDFSAPAGLNILAFSGHSGKTKLRFNIEKIMSQFTVD